MKKKIVFISLNSYEFFFETPNVTHGGAELQMYYLANAISKNNKFEVSFIVGDYGQKKKIVSGNIQFYKTYNLPAKENNIKKTIKMLSLFILLVKVNPDLIVSSSAASWLFIMAIYKKLFQKKHLHRTASLLEVNKEWIKQNGIRGRLFEFGLEKADIIITQSKEHRALLQINHGINAILLKNGLKQLPKELIPKTYVLWVGRYDPVKQPDLFLKIAKELTDIQFLMICPGNSTFQKEYNALHKTAQNMSNLIFIPEVPFHQIQKYFDSAKIFVNTSVAEGFPNTFLQAAAASVPVFSLNVNPDNYLTDHNCGIYAENNIIGLSESIEKYYTENEKTEEMGQRHYEYFIENHLLANIEKQFNTIIENLFFQQSN